MSELRDVRAFVISESSIISVCEPNAVQLPGTPFGIPRHWGPM